jgi:hypothetical protein
MDEALHSRPCFVKVSYFICDEEQRQLDSNFQALYHNRKESPQEVNF